MPRIVEVKSRKFQGFGLITLITLAKIATYLKNALSTSFGQLWRLDVQQDVVIWRQNDVILSFAAPGNRKGGYKPITKTRPKQVGEASSTSAV